MLPSDIAAKLNECANTDFASKRDWWFALISWATGLVAFGLVLEAPELVHDLIPIGRKIVAKLNKLPIEFQKHEPPDWVKVVAFFGWILIVVGVVGEEFAGIKVKNLDVNIQECSDAKVQAATLEAGQAAKSAEIVHGDAVDLLKKYEVAERELTELKAAQLPRRLSSAQKDKLSQLVTAFATKSIFVGCLGDRIETWDFEQDFVKVFANPALRFKLEYALSCSVMYGPVMGPRASPIGVEAGAERQGDKDILVKALKEIGINKKEIVTNSNPNKSLLALTIGPKPE